MPVAPQIPIQHLHIGRSWEGHEIEDECGCEQAPCGLAISGRRHPDCVQHRADKSLRQQHLGHECPALKEAS